MNRPSSQDKSPSISSIPKFQLQEEHSSKSSFSLPSFTQVIPSISTPLNIPPFFPEDILSKRSNHVDLGNSVFKKAKFNPKPSVLSIPSFKPDASDSPLQKSFPTNLRLPSFLDELNKLRNPHDSSFNNIENQLSQENPKLLEKESLSETNSTKGKRTNTASVNSEQEESSPKAIDKKDAKKGKVKILKKKEVITKKTTLTEESIIPKYITEGEIKEIFSNNRSNKILPSFDLNSLSTPHSGSLQIPKFIEMAEEESKEREPVNQLQNALQALQDKLQMGAQHKFGMMQNLHGHQNGKASLEALLDNFTKNFGIKNLFEEPSDRSSLEKAILRDLALLDSINNLQASPFASNQTPLTNEQSQDNIGIPGVTEASNQEAQTKKEKSSKSEKDKATIKPNNQITSKTSTELSTSIISSETQDKQEKDRRKKVAQKVVEVKETVKVTQVSVEEAKAPEKLKEKENNKTAVKVVNKKISKTVRLKKKSRRFKATTKKGVIIVSRWNLESQRRKNRWQMIEDDQRMKMLMTSRTTVKSGSKAGNSANGQRKNVRETHVGTDYQVDKVPLEPQKGSNPRRGPPRLKWDPKCIKRGILDFYFRKICEKLECELSDISQEKAIRLLQQHDFNTKKVFQLIDGNEDEYRREFGVRDEEESEGSRSSTSL